MYLRENSGIYPGVYPRENSGIYTRVYPRVGGIYLRVYLGWEAYTSGCAQRCTYLRVCTTVYIPRGVREAYTRVKPQGVHQGDYNPVYTSGCTSGRLYLRVYLMVYLRVCNREAIPGIPQGV